MQRTTLSTVILLVVLAAALVAPGAITGLAPVAAQTGACGITVLVDGAPFWVALPCGALTPPVTVAPASATPTVTATAMVTSTPTPTLTPTLTPSATATRTPSPTPSWTPGTTATPFPTPTQEAVYLTTARLNLRTGPGTGYDVITTLPAGVPVERLSTPPVAANGFTWWEIATAGGAQGWAASKYLEVAP